MITIAVIGLSIGIACVSFVVGYLYSKWIERMERQYKNEFILYEYDEQ